MLYNFERKYNLKYHARFTRSFLWSISISYLLNSWFQYFKLDFNKFNFKSLKISTLKMTSTLSYAFYVSSSVSEVTTLSSKLITIKISKLGVQNCKNWISTDNKIWSILNSGYIFSSGSWVIKTTSPSKSSSSSANAAKWTMISTVSVSSTIILITSTMIFFPLLLY